MATAIRRFGEVVGNAWGPFRIWLLLWAGVIVFGSTLNHGSLFIFEDSSGLPWTGPITYTFKVQYWIWSALRLTEPWQYHLLNLSVHALTAIMVGLVAVRLWPKRKWVPYYGDGMPERTIHNIRWSVIDPKTSSRSQIGWACGSIFWLHPLAIPAVGYASALPEMLVCLGAVTLTWTLLQDRTWYWLCAAGLILFVTLNVKSSAIGVLLLPAVVLIVRPIQRRGFYDWLWVGLIPTLVVIVATLVNRVGFIVFGNTYPWHRWPEEMLPMAAQAGMLITQSILPTGIAFQLDPLRPWMGGLVWTALALSAVFGWLNRSKRPIVAFGFLYVLALITVRLVVPTSNWLDRAPEMWYTQQWYPALPGMVWLLVSLFAPADASRAEPSVS